MTVQMCTNNKLCFSFYVSFFSSFCLFQQKCPTVPVTGPRSTRALFPGKTPERLGRVCVRISEHFDATLNHAN